jgi:WXG100 family type VII secretion target
MAEKIQVRYTRLDLLIYQAYDQAYQVNALYEKLRSQKETLKNSWQGGSAAEFQGEMEEVVLPRLKRLSHALKETGDLFEKIKAIFQVAEQEAVACFPDGSEAAQNAYIEWAHHVLTAAGFVEWGGIGIAAGVIDTALYAYEGRWSEAGWSLVSTVPFGDYIKLSRMGAKGLKAGDEMIELGLESGGKFGDDAAGEMIEAGARKSRKRLKNYLEENGVYLDRVEVPNAPTKTVLGTKIEEPIRELVAKKYGFELPAKKSSSVTGPDLVIPMAERSRIGFDFGEIKPLNEDGLRKFFEQIDNWGDRGWAGGPQSASGKTALFGYDELGDIYLVGIWEM